MRSARSMEAAALASRPEAASACALSMMLATAVLSFRVEGLTGSGDENGPEGAGWRSDGVGEGDGAGAAQAAVSKTIRTE